MSTSLREPLIVWRIAAGLALLTAVRIAYGEDPQSAVAETAASAMAEGDELKDALAQKMLAAEEQELAWQRFRAREKAKKDAEKRGVRSAAEAEEFRRLREELADAGREVSEKADAFSRASKHLSDVQARTAAARPQQRTDQPRGSGASAGPDQTKGSGNPLSKLKSRLGRDDQPGSAGKGSRKPLGPGETPPFPDRPQSFSKPTLGEVDLRELPPQSTAASEPVLEVAGPPRGPGEVKPGTRYSFDIDIRNTATDREASGWVEAAIVIGEGTIEGKNPRQVIVPAGETVTLRWDFVPTRLDSGRLRYGARVLEDEDLESGDVPPAESTVDRARDALNTLRLASVTRPTLERFGTAEPYERLTNPLDIARITYEEELLERVDHEKFVAMEEADALKFVMNRRDAGINAASRRAGEDLERELLALERAGLVRRGEDLLQRQRTDPKVATALAAALSRVAALETQRGIEARHECLELMEHFYEAERVRADRRERYAHTMQVLQDEGVAINEVRDKAAADAKAVFDQLAAKSGRIPGWEEMERQARTDPVIRQAWNSLQAISQRANREEAMIRQKSHGAFAELLDSTSP